MGWQCFYSLPNAIPLHRDCSPAWELGHFYLQTSPTLRKGRLLTWGRVKYTDRELSQVEITQEIQRYLKILHLEIYFKQLMESSQAKPQRHKTENSVAPSPLPTCWRSVKSKKKWLWGAAQPWHPEYLTQHPLKVSVASRSTS